MAKGWRLEKKEIKVVGESESVKGVRAGELCVVG